MSINGFDDLVEFSNRLLLTDDEETEFWWITEKMEEITGADYVILNTFLENGMEFKTLAVTGSRVISDQVRGILGFDPLNRVWTLKAEKAEKIKHKRISRFQNVNELFKQEIPETVIERLVKVFESGKAYVLKIVNAERIVGTFTLIYKKGKDLKNRKRAILFSDMIALFLMKQKTDRRYKKLFENSNTAFFIHDLSGRVVDVNQKACDLLGYSKDELLKKNVKNFPPKKDSKVTEKAFKDVSDKRYVYLETVFVRKDKTLRPVSLNASLFDQTNGFVLGAVKDLSEQKRLETLLLNGEEKLQDLEIERMHQLFENMTSGVAIYEAIDEGKDFKLVKLNRAGLHLKKVNKEEVIGKTINSELKHIFDSNHINTIRKVWETGKNKEPDKNKYHSGKTTKWRENQFFKLPSGEVVEIFNDITEKENAKREKTIAEAANKAKSEFLSTMSHELRTPLNGVIGFSEILKSTSLDKNQLDYLDIILTSANHLLDIIGEILDFSRIEARSFELHPEKTDLRVLIEKTTSLLRCKAEQKGLVLSTDIADNVPRIVEVDNGRLKQILLNLLSNAVKFTENGGVYLTVALSEEQKEKNGLRFKVTDTGIGINEKDKERIFKPFQQLDMSNTRRYGGTGLGVTITNNLLQKMGSTLELDSTYGKGSEFSFVLTLPCTEERTSPDQAKPFEDAEDALFKYKTLLVVEDDKVNMKYAKTALHMFSKEIQIIEAKNGEEAYERYLRHKPDLILMDVIMPGIDGYQATGMIRQHDKTIPIIAMTAKAMKGDKEACHDAGMNDYLTKPVTLNRLKDMLKKYL